MANNLWSLVFGQDGTLPVLIRNGSNVQPDQINYITNTVSTKEVEIQSNIDIFPNPFKNSISIQSDEQIIKTEMYNSNGVLVKYNNNSNLDIVHLNTTNLPNGIYLVKCTFNTGIITKKIISNK